MGANASGKTSLGRMMCKINNYLAGRPVEDTPSKICDKDSNASFEVKLSIFSFRKIIVIFHYLDLN
jgi:hypothetical protein